MNILDRFRHFLIRCFEISYQYHKLTLALALITFVSIMAFFKPLEVHVTVDDLINKDDEVSKEYFKLKKDFNLHTNAFLIFEKEGKGSFESAQLCQIKKWLILQGLAIPHIKYSYSPLFLRESRLDVSEQGFQRLDFPLIVYLACEGEVAKSDPLAGIDKTPWQGLLVNKKHDDFVHEYQIGHLNEKNFVMEKIIPLMDGLKASAKELSGVKIHWLGDASYQAEMTKGILFNNALNGIVVFFLLIAFRLLFGTWLSGIIYLGTLIFSCLVIFGLMSLTGTPMDVLNSSLFLFLAVSSLGDFIFLSQHELDKGSPERHWSTTFKELITPCFFTSFTTFIGFISLCTSEVEIIRRLGFWVGWSGAVEWIATLIIMPALMKMLFKKGSWVNREKSISIRNWSFLRKINFGRKLSLFLLSAFLIAPFCFKHLNVSDSPMELFLKNNPFRQSVNYLFDTRGFQGEVSLVFNNNEDEAFNRSVLEKIKKHPNVARVDDPYEVLNFFSEKLSPTQADLMNKSLKQTPQFRRYFSDDRVRAVVYLKAAELKDIYEMKNEVKNNFCSKNECILSGLLVAYAAFSQEVSATLLTSFSVSFTLVFITIFFLSYYTNNMKYIFPLMVSSMWGGAMVLVALATLQIKINFMTSLVVAIMVGMNGDNTIQFILGGMDSGIHEGVEERATGSIITISLLILSSGIFLFHYFEPPTTFGLLLMFGFFASLVGDLWILKGLISDKKNPT